MVYLENRINSFFISSVFSDQWLTIKILHFIPEFITTLTDTTQTITSLQIITIRKLLVAYHKPLMKFTYHTLPPQCCAVDNLTRKLHGARVKNNTSTVTR